MFIVLGGTKLADSLHIVEARNIIGSGVNIAQLPSEAHCSCLVLVRLCSLSRRPRSALRGGLVQKLWSTPVILWCLLLVEGTLLFARLPDLLPDTIGAGPCGRVLCYRRRHLLRNRWWWWRIIIGGSLGRHRAAGFGMRRRDRELGLGGGDENGGCHPHSDQAERDDDDGGGGAGAVGGPPGTGRHVGPSSDAHSHPTGKWIYQLERREEAHGFFFIAQAWRIAGFRCVPWLAGWLWERIDGEGGREGGRRLAGSKPKQQSRGLQRGAEQQQQQQQQLMSEPLDGGPPSRGERILIPPGPTGQRGEGD
jgi:hypothetical protein